jgi:hypothetical protein
MFCPGCGQEQISHGSWSDTNDLAQQSVTEGTTKLIKEG